MSDERKAFVFEAARALEFLDEVLGDLEHESLDVNLAGDVLTLNFADGDTFVINAHSAARQIWMAAGTRAWHFDYDAEELAWIATKTGDELMTTVAKVVGAKLDQPIAL